MLFRGGVVVGAVPVWYGKQPDIHLLYYVRKDFLANSDILEFFRVLGG
jgi:hypothetical protein